jgi:hypothetical protein
VSRGTSILSFDLKASLRRFRHGLFASNKVAVLIEHVGEIISRPHRSSTRGFSLHPAFVTPLRAVEGDRYSQNFRPRKTKHLSRAMAGLETVGELIGGWGLAASLAIALQR